MLGTTFEDDPKILTTERSYNCLKNYDEKYVCYDKQLNSLMYIPVTIVLWWVGIKDVSFYLKWRFRTKWKISSRDIGSLQVGAEEIVGVLGYSGWDLPQPPKIDFR